MGAKRPDQLPTDELERIHAQVSAELVRRNSQMAIAPYIAEATCLRDEVERLKRRNEELETAFRTLRDTHELVTRLTKVIEWFENIEEE